MIKVLQVYPKMNKAGTEGVIMNWYRNINRSEIQFDFLVSEEGYFDKEIINLGGKIYYSNGLNNYLKKLEEILKNGEYNIIQVHTQGYMGEILKIAKKYNVKCRIAHSHNARQDAKKIYYFYQIIRNWKTEKYATHFVACSNEAAKWRYPRKYKKCKVIPNGVESEKFSFKPEERDKSRKELGVTDEKVIMTVARLSYQKNPKFIIDLAKEINNDNYKFFIVGDGPLKEEITKLVDEIK